MPRLLTLTPHTTTSGRSLTTRRIGAGLTALAVAGSIVVGGSAAQAATAAAGSPIGNFEAATAVTGGIKVRGWAADGDAPKAPLTIKISVAGATSTVTTTVPRPDVPRAFTNLGPNTGFETTIPLPKGSHQVCVTAVNIGSGSDKAFACRTTTVENGTSAPTPSQAAATTADHTAFRYGGHWSASKARGEHFTKTAGRTASITARIGQGGGTVSLQGILGTNKGIAAISIDGAPEVTASQHRTPGHNGTYFTTPHLNAGEHTITIRATGNRAPGGTDSYIAITGATTTNGTLTTPPANTTIAPALISKAGVDSTFTIAVIPDTQTDVFGSDRITNRSQWLVANRDALDLEFVLHTGDVVNWDTPDHQQYINASASLRPLDDAGIPTTLAIGNHDTDAVGVGGGARPGVNAWEAVRDTGTFNKFFPTSRYGVEGTFEPNKIDNNYQLFSAGGEDWMILTLELWARPQAIEWAKRVVAANPDRNVLVMTHAYLDAGGQISTSNGGYGSTSPKYLFDNLISKYSNIKMVFSGHVGAGASRTDTGANGNKIVSYLGCYHSSTSNPIRLIEIDTSDDTVSTRVYSPNNGQLISADQKVNGMSFSPK